MKIYYYFQGKTLEQAPPVKPGELYMLTRVIGKEGVVLCELKLFKTQDSQHQNALEQALTHLTNSS